ncbi:MAG TPA: HAMP domain-containing sensor histidine kinase [Longimicrobiales bacterium]
MALSLRQRILRTSLASTLVVVFAAFLLVDGIIRDTVTRDQRETLAAGARLVSQLQSAAIDDHIDRTASLASVPTLRAAVETGDSSTIEANLGGLLAGAEADWIAVTDPAGRLLAATPGTPSLARADRLIESARSFDSAELWAENGALEQVHASGIFFGATQLGVVLTGVRIGADRVEQMEDATQQRVAFVANGDVVAVGREMTERARADLARAWGDAAAPDAGSIREFELDGERHMGSAIELPDGRTGLAGHLITFRSLDAAMQPARTVRYVLLGIAALGIAFALGASYVLARRVTQPVDRLLAETVRLGTGDLDTPIRAEREDEIGRLALGFEEMRQSLASARHELVRAERLSAVGRAASAIVHDIKQPVAAISGNVELLRDDWADERARNEDLDAIGHELKRLNTMMSEVLDFARGGDVMRMDIGSVPDLLHGVERSMHATLRGTGIALVVEHGYTGLWTLDFARTHRVLENLARNAAAALARGPGRIVLRSALAADGGLRLEVEDDGPGIPEAIRDTLFEPFVTHGKREGTGLGLAIVKAFVERQGGAVTYTTSSSGTRFIIEFPAGGAA